MTSTKSKSTKVSKASKKISQAKSIKKLIVPDAWLNELATLEIDQENWKCSVMIIEETSPEAVVYIEHFNEAAIDGTRLAVKAISKQEVMKAVFKGMTVNRTTREPSPRSLLCDEIFKSVGQGFGEEIPTELLAPLIKYMILEFKDLNKRVREGLKEKEKELEENQQSLWSQGKGKAASKGSPSSKTEGKSTKSGKSVKEKAKGKTSTKLRKRGEEWKDKTWIDDAPIDGPKLYVVISTFFDANLPLELLRLNIPLKAITKLQLFEYPSIVYNKKSSVTSELLSILNSLQEFHRNSIPYLNVSVRYRFDTEKEFLANKMIQIQRFWEKISILKNEIPTALMFKDIMFLHFVPCHFDFKYQIKVFQQEIYRQISHFFYDAYEITQQHKAYLKEINILDVSDHELCDLDTTVYKSILDEIPNEVLSLPFLLDAIIAQVCLNIDGTKENSGTVKTEMPSEEYILNIENQSLLKLLQDLNFKYDLSYDWKDQSTDAGSPSTSLVVGRVSSSNINKVFIFFDNINIKTIHLEKNVAEFIGDRTNYILKTAWNHFLEKSFTNSKEDGNFNKLCNEIIKVNGKGDNNGLYYYIYLLIINKLINSILLVQSAESSVKVNSLRESGFRYDREDLCEQCFKTRSSDLFTNLESFLKNKVSSISCYYDLPSGSVSSLSDDVIANSLFYVEDMTSDVLLQKIQAISTEFNYLETNYCPFTDQSILVFHNFQAARRHALEENWVGKLTTLVPIRDFVEYVVDEERVWLEANAQSDDESVQDFFNISQNTSCSKELKTRVISMVSDSEFISHRSLKYETLMEQKNTSKLTRSSKANSKSTLEKIKSGSVKISEGDSKGKLKKSKANSKDKRNSEEVKRSFTFTGYNLGDPMRFQFSGCKKDKILDNQCRITLNRVKKLYGEELFNLSLSICDHGLYLSYNPSAAETYEMLPFHMILSSGIVLNFTSRPSNELVKKVSSFSNQLLRFNVDKSQKHFLMRSGTRDEIRIIRNVDISKVPFESFEDSLFEGVRNSTFRTYDLVDTNYFVIPSSYYLKMSTPSGLYVELIQEDGLLYVRQELLSEGLLCQKMREMFRCSLSSGHILKFMENGEFEVLGATGEIYNIYEIKTKSVNKNEEHSTVEISKQEETKNKASGRSVSRDKNILKDVFKKLSKHQGDVKHQKDDDPKQQNTPNKSSIFLETNEIKEPVNDLLKGSHYRFTTSDGSQFLVQDSEIKTLNTLFMSSSINIENNCIDGDRLDGVKTCHYADGSMLVTFPDGSCITSTPVESEEFFCEWTSEELDQWFAGPSTTFSLTSAIDDSKSDSQESCLKDGSSIKVSSSTVCSNSSKQQLDISSTESVKSQNSQIKRILNSDSNSNSILGKSEEQMTVNLSASSDDLMNKRNKPYYSDDGFVVYNISYLICHPNYCSVFYDAHRCEVEIKLPFETRITLKRDGSYEGFFDGASLSVDGNEIYFKRVQNNKILRTHTIKNSAYTRKNSSVYSNNSSFYSDYQNYNTLKKDVHNFSYFRSLIQDIDLETNVYNKLDSIILYGADLSGNEIFIDYDFKIIEIPRKNEIKRIKGSEFSSFVINRDFSGFRLVSDDEVDEHVQNVAKENGLIVRTDDFWGCILTSLEINTNESEKWLMHCNKETLENPKEDRIVSTYGRRESWFHPFVEKDEEQNIIIPDATVIRLFHRIPTEESVLIDLKTALKCFRKSSESKNLLKVEERAKKGAFDLFDIVSNPNRLLQIYKEEQITLKKENDKFRVNMKDNFLRSLVRQGCIRARKARQKMKETELKTAMREKKIPPYHISCFGRVHSVLNEVIEHVLNHRKSLSTISTYERVNCIIDDILSTVHKAESVSTESDEGDTKDICYTKSAGVDSLVNNIFGRVCALTQARSEQNLVNEILEKPINSVTKDDVEFLCKRFESKEQECPILYGEDFILEDVLNVGHELSHYFRNLREILEFHRGNLVYNDTVVTTDNIKCNSILCDVSSE